MKSWTRFLSSFLLLCVVVLAAVVYHDSIQQTWSKATHFVSASTAKWRGAAGGMSEGEYSGILSQKRVFQDGSHVQAAEDLEQELSFYYAYRQLDSEAQAVYRTFLSAIYAMEPSFEVESVEAEVVDLAYDAIVADHPELFWLGGYTITSYLLGETVKKQKIEPEYLLGEELRDARRLQIEQQTEEIADKALSAGSTEYDWAIYVYRYLIDRLDYDPLVEDNQTICSVFLSNRSVCMGYAKSFQYLMQKLGMECTLISGEAEGDAHAWNLLRIEGEYYYVDPTWGDGSFSDPEGAAQGAGETINYVYFGMNDEELFLTHKPDTAFLLPACTARECNYYVREGLLYDYFDTSEIGGLIWDTQESGADSVTFRFSDAEEYAHANRHLIEENKIFDYCQGKSNLRYRADPQYLVFTIYYQ